VKCPKCGATRGRVVSSRSAGDGGEVRRRRACGACGHRFTTVERVTARRWAVKKRGGGEEPFDAAKLRRSVEAALAKRPAAGARVASLAADVERKLRREFPEEVPSTAIGQAVLVRLAALDEVAYLRYASVFRRFRDAAQFAAEARRFAARK